MATIRKRPSKTTGDLPIVRYVVDTGSPNPKSKALRKQAGKAVRAAKKAVDPKSAAKAAKKARPAAVKYTALAAPERSNPFLVGRKKAIEIAKRAGILDEAGNLQSFYR
ncbi:hypothetical protein [Achromobacter anxifer]|uniref:hypothetical protein n=1 Tax=Achromobacter anxifer TaxID=1287737 RepID=UPI0023F70D3E|nr:hypothetical protein [Achromobacter anxifer]MDF8363361.1 hypothetical protein [Achromobacter anxifer]